VRKRLGNLDDLPLSERKTLYGCGGINSGFAEKREDFLGALGETSKIGKEFEGGLPSYMPAGGPA
jgi:hypothetical protein